MGSRAWQKVEEEEEAGCREEMGQRGKVTKCTVILEWFWPALRGEGQRWMGWMGRPEVWFKVKLTSRKRSPGDCDHRPPFLGA